MKKLIGVIESVDFENDDYTLVTFRVPITSSWSLGEYEIAPCEQSSSNGQNCGPYVDQRDREEFLQFLQGHGVPR